MMSLRKYGYRLLVLYTGGGERVERGLRAV